MDDSIGKVLLWIAGALLIAIIANRTAHVGHKWTGAKKDIKNVCDQVSSYWQLEKLYKEEVAKYTNEAAQTVLVRMRDRVRTLENGRFVKIEMTTNDAESIKKKYE